jgi:hypothetical protein
MNIALSKEIQAFERQLPKLRKDHGAVWAVMVGSNFKAGFREFKDAAAFAIEHFPDKEFLIRHTEEQQAEIPFIAVDD